MYLINYDFYDLYNLIVYFRYAPERFAVYKAGFCKIITYIESPEKNYADFNNIRNILKPCYNQSDEALSWILVDNRYTANIVVIKETAVYEVILSVLCEIVEHYENSERFCLLCDATHNIPLILVDEIKRKRLIGLMVKEYRKKYNDSFLKDELKRL